MKKIWIVATFDTKAQEANYLAELIAPHAAVVTVDLSTKAPAKRADITAVEVADYHPDGAEAVFTEDRGSAVGAMALAFEQFITMRSDVGAMIGLGGSGGTALITRAMQRLPLGTPKLMLSTVASGQVAPYVGVTDMMMMYSVTDLAGLNRLSKTILANAAGAIVGAFQQAMSRTIESDERKAMGLTMFGVTTPCVQHLTQQLQNQFDPLVFHATGTGGRAMEKLLDDGFLQGVIDVTTTEIADLMFGGVLACDSDRFGALIRTRKPAVISVGALDMVNFASVESVPAQFKHRLLYQHNPQVTLMRTTPSENTMMGQWIAERLNQCEGPVRVVIPTAGISALDAPGQAFWNPLADQALFDALAKYLHQTPTRQLVMSPYHINSPDFATLLFTHFTDLIRVYDYA